MSLVLQHDKCQQDQFFVYLSVLFIIYSWPHLSVFYSASFLLLKPSPLKTAPTSHRKRCDAYSISYIKNNENILLLLLLLTNLAPQENLYTSGEADADKFVENLPVTNYSVVNLRI